MSDDLDDRPLLSVRPRRLSASIRRSDDCPSYVDLGLSNLLEEAVRWQVIRSNAWFLEFSSATFGWRMRDRFHEVCGLFGSSAEMVILAAAGEVEIRLLTNAMADGTLPEQYGMCQRFFADGICNTIVAVTNRMVNIGLRVAMIHPDYPWGLLTKDAKRGPFPPFSDARDDWVNLGSMQFFEAVATASKKPALRSLHGAVRRLTSSSAWKQAETVRAEGHHRWRYESPYVEGLDRKSMWIPGEGFVSLEGPDAPYTEATDIVADTCAVAHEGLLRLGRAMGEFRRAFERSVSVVTDGSLRWNRVRESFSWSPTVASIRRQKRMRK